MKPSFEKYIPFKQINLPDRQWPNNTITKAPIWCSVDLRDGNQALVDPMNLEEKLEFFHALCDMGFKEIEIGFPSASETEYEICRELIENNHIPDDVTIQVLVQAREHLIRKTFDAVKGAKNVIVHFYNSTSTLQRKVVFKTDMDGVIKIAVDGAKLIKQLTDEYDGDTNFRFEYSPESFSGTEPENAVEICDRVIEALGSTAENKLIVNLPNTVEMCTPTHMQIRLNTLQEILNTVTPLLSVSTRTMTVDAVLPQANLHCLQALKELRVHSSATVSVQVIWISLQWDLICSHRALILSLTFQIFQSSVKSMSVAQI